MQTNKGEKLKVPRTAAQIQTIRDQIKQLDDILRDIKAGMIDNGVESIDLKIKTFLYYLSEMRDIAIDWKGVYEKAEIRQKLEPVRERIKAEIEEKNKKR